MGTELGYGGTDGWPLQATTIGTGPLVVLLHGGGPDHHSLRPLGERLADRFQVALPDIRGYGRSVCPDPVLHTWHQYAEDVVALVDALDAPTASLVGTGLGGTIALRAALASPERVRELVLISVEDIEDDEAKAAEAAQMDAFADTIRADGLEAAWALYLPHLQPLIAELVRDAIPRTDPASAAAAAAIGHDRAFTEPAELAAIDVPTLVIPGDDVRHPRELAAAVANVLPRGRLADVGMSSELRTADDLAEAFAPAIRRFLSTG
jgi:3-oxoadipate enol-lactonase